MGLLAVNLLQLKTGKEGHFIGPTDEIMFVAKTASCFFIHSSKSQSLKVPVYFENIFNPATLANN
jgi:hypothetical protein